MKTVFDNDMLAHVWAQRSQPYGRSSNGNFYFDAGTLYSYGSHFIVAKFVSRRDDRDQLAVLFNNRTYSLSTSRHQRLARLAVHGLGLAVFSVSNPDPRTDADHLANYTALIAARDKAAEASPRARSDWKRDWLRSEAERLDNDAAAYAAAFIKGDPGKLAKRLQRESAKAERERKQREAERAAALEAAKVAMMPIVDDVHAQWRGGANEGLAIGRAHFALPGMTDLERFALRELFGAVTLLRVNGDNVETSRGAEFPVEHAKRSFPVLAAIVARGEPWEASSPIRLGHFTVDRVEFENGAATVVAGCHRVAWAEVERCARELGLVELAPAL